MIEAVLHFIWIAILWGMGYVVFGGVIGLVTASIFYLQNGARVPITKARVKDGLHLIVWLAVFWPGALGIAFVMLSRRQH